MAASSNTDQYGNFYGGQPAPTPMVTPILSGEHSKITYAGPPLVNPPNCLPACIDVNHYDWQWNATTKAWS